MAQKNFDIDDRLADEFKSFCRSRGIAMSHAAGASLLWFMNASAQERDQACLRYDNYVGESASKPSSQPLRRAAAKKKTPKTSKTTKKTKKKR